MEEQPDRQNARHKKAAAKSFPPLSPFPRKSLPHFTILFIIFSVLQYKMPLKLSAPLAFPSTNKLSVSWLSRLFQNKSNQNKINRTGISSPGKERPESPVITPRDKTAKSPLSHNLLLLFSLIFHQNPTDQSPPYTYPAASSPAPRSSSPQPFRLIPWHACWDGWCWTQ